jgi:hypothetical protein
MPGQSASAFDMVMIDDPLGACRWTLRPPGSDPLGNMVWYVREKTNHKSSDHEPISVIAHKGETRENPNDCQSKYKEREQSYPNQHVGNIAVEGPITNDIGSDREPKSVIAHKGDIYENPNDREPQ